MDDRRGATVTIPVFDEKNFGSRMARLGPPTKSFKMNQKTKIFDFHKSAPKWLEVVETGKI